MSKKTVVTSEKAPEAIGPYSAAIKTESLIFTSGQLGIDRATGTFAEGGIEAETEQALKNLQAVLNAAGSDLKNVVKVTVFLRDINDFTRMNSVYAKFFTENYPARSAFQVAALPRGAAVEIEAIALP